MPLFIVNGILKLIVKQFLCIIDNYVNCPIKVMNIKNTNIRLNIIKVMAPLITMPLKCPFKFKVIILNAIKTYIIKLSTFNIPLKQLI